MKWLLILCGFIACAGKAVSDDCAATLSPSRVVVKYNHSFSANCSSSSSLMEGMGWESSQGGVPLTNGVSFLTLTVESVTDWKIAPVCFFNLQDGSQCPHNLPVTVYKMPDTVSMSKPSPANPMVEGAKYLFECDVANVAPVMSLSVHLVIGDQTVEQHDYFDPTLTPVNKSDTFKYTANGDDNGAQVLCKAKLKFGQADPNPPAMQSNSHKLIVHYPPKFNSPANMTLNDTKRSDMTLNCTARGNPTPVYTWQLPQSVQEKMKNHKEAQLTLPWELQLAGTYSCTASNDRGSKTKYFTIVQAPTGSRPGATAGILMAVIILLILILGCVLYLKKRNSRQSEQMS